jgi:hypothetical protein
VHLQVAQQYFDLAEPDAWVLHHSPGRGQSRFTGQPGHDFVERGIFCGTLYHELDRAGRIAQDDELDGLLVPHDLDKSLYGDFLSDMVAELRDKHSLHEDYFSKDRSFPDEFVGESIL